MLPEKFIKFGPEPIEWPALKNAPQIQANIPLPETLLEEPSFRIENCYISANPLQSERFDEETTYIQASPAIETLISQECQKKLENSPTTYITGPVGMGKSYAILVYVLLHRKERDAILYINNPIALLQNWSQYVINEVIYTISGDLEVNLERIGREVFGLKPDNEITYDSIMAIFRDMLEYYDSERILNLIRSLHVFYKNQEKKFLLVFDQFNKYEEESQKHEKWRKCTDDLISSFPRKVFGRSTLEPIATSIKYQEIFLGSNFKFEQAFNYLQNKLSQSVLLDHIQLAATSSDQNDMKFFDKIKETTELIPYELEVLRRTASKFPKYSVEELLDEYYSVRIREIQEIHKKWINKLNSVERESLYEFIFTLDNSLASEQRMPMTPDASLMYYNDKVKHWCYISRLVKEAVFQYYRNRASFIKYVGGELVKYIKEMVRIMLDNNTPGRTKGGIFERFVEYSIRVAIRNQEEYQLQCFSKAKIEYLIKLPLKNTRIRNFDSQNLKSQILKLLEEKDVGVLFPINPNFAYVDFLMIDSREDNKRMIYLFQVTINVKNHEASDVFYQNEMRKLVEKKKDRVEIISQVMHQIIEESQNVQTRFIWIGGDDLHVDPNKLYVDPKTLLSHKNPQSWITLTRFNPQMYKFLV